MSTETSPTRPPVNPRPGVLRALGICNIVLSVLSGMCILWSGLIMIAAMSNPAPPGSVPAKVEVKVGAPPRPAGPMIGFNPFMGMNDPHFLRFSYVENGASLITNGLMFATGIGLVNLRRWAARWWTYLAWLKIALPILLWGYFIVAVAPSFSESLAKNVLEMLRSQAGNQGRLPSVAELTRIYSIMSLIMAVGAMVIGALYPAISLWLLGRPGVQAAIVDKPAKEPELT